MKRCIAAVALACTVPVYAWGPEGHDLVARIAEAQLLPAVRTKVAEILGPGVSMASISSWADTVRRERPETGPWHYANIPIDKPHLDMERDCPKDCVIKKIEDLEVVLRDPATTPVQRREALMFLIHFVGDMHQPLHSSDNNDKGGNDVHVAFHDRPYNLHSMWDSGLLGRIGKEDELFAGWSNDSARHAKKWSKGTVEQWAEQAHKIAQKTVYGRLPPAATGQPIAITANYEQRADREIREQIEKAGARLARVLNEALR